jgi:hypothetical protein
VLYPEVGRLLAYQGADMLVVQAASTDYLLYEKLRAGTLARMQDNQLFAAVSFLVGDNQLSGLQRTPFTGKSAIFAPQELTPRSNGVLVEMGNLRSEGVLAAQWDFVALRDLWETSETPVRRQLPLQQAGQFLSHLYARLQALPKVAELDQLPDVVAPPMPSRRGEAGMLQSLDDLVVIAAVTQPWPPQLDTHLEMMPSFGHAGETNHTGLKASVDTLVASVGENDSNKAHMTETRYQNTKTEDNGEDETDEMDAVAGTEAER